MEKASTIKLLGAVVLGILICLPAINNAAPLAGIFHQRCITRADIIKLRADLKITPEQKQALKGLREKTRSTIASLKQQAAALRYQTAETILAEQIDTENAEAKIAQLIQLRGQIQDIVLHARLQGAQLLTPEQRARILEEVNKIKQCREAQQNHAAEAQETPADILPGLLF
jgi:Spy/CpxP family protein refolding chaperone